MSKKKRGATQEQRDKRRFKMMIGIHKIVSGLKTKIEELERENYTLRRTLEVHLQNDSKWKSQHKKRHKWASK